MLLSRSIIRPWPPSFARLCSQSASLASHPVASRLVNVNNRTYSSSSSHSKGSNVKLVVGSSILVLALFDEYYTNRYSHIYKIAKRSGIVTVSTIKCFIRYRKVLSAKYDTPENYEKALSKCHHECATITYEALATNGGIYIKLGQHLAAMTYLLPPEWPEAMVPLQDQCPQSSLKEIDQLFKEDMNGQGINDLFSEFNETPIGVASLAQVHTAVLKSNPEEVIAVKCQHPSLKEFVPLDLMLTQTVFKYIAKFFPEFDLNWLGDELQHGIFIELDFNIEAKNSKDTANYFKDYKNVTALRVPEIYLNLKRILFMEYLPGNRLDDLEYIDSHKISRSQVSTCLAHIFNSMIFTPNVGIHCDPHGGNLAIRAINPPDKYGHNFEIILYDHGQYRNAETSLRRSYAKMWLATLDSNVPEMKKYANEFAGITDDQFMLFMAAVTGRDYEHAFDVKSARTQAEFDKMIDEVQKGDTFEQIMKMLSSLPRIVLLIFKTNDLVRNLDERLQNPLGLEKSFLIMANYCSKIIYGEDRENLDHKYTKGSISWIIGWLRIWWKHESRVLQLSVYDHVASIHNLAKWFG